MSTITETLAVIGALQDRLLSENASTSQDIEKAEATVKVAHQTVTDAIRDSHNTMRAAIDAAFGQVLRDLQAVRELRQTAILDAIGPEPTEIEGEQTAMLQAAE